MTTTKQSTWGATLRTTILLASLSGLLVVIGALIGGPTGRRACSWIFALLMNFFSSFFSDKLALTMAAARSRSRSPKTRGSTRSSAN